MFRKMRVLILGFLEMSLLLVSCGKEVLTEFAAPETDVDQPGKLSDLSIHDPEWADLHAKNLAAFPIVESITGLKAHHPNY
jgi:hypothetical protein